MTVLKENEIFDLRVTKGFHGSFEEGVVFLSSFLTFLLHLFLCS